MDTYLKIRYILQQYWLQIIWALLNFVIFYKNLKALNNEPEYYYLRKILGIGLCISRGTAPLLNLSCCLVILPMCRTLNTLIHTILSHISSKILSAYLSRVKIIHFTLAYTIFIVSVIHTVAHVINAINFSRKYNPQYADINWASYKNQNPLYMVFGTLPGLTGVIMFIILLLLIATSTRCFRNIHFNVFWLMHNLVIVFYFLLFLHPLSGVITKQTNIKKHIPGCYTHGLFFLNSTNVICQEVPEFTSVESKGWIWILIPLLIYLSELLLRLYTRNKCKPIILQLYRLPGDAIYLTLLLRKSSLKFKPGQYILIRCDQLSRLEWHPFTIISYTQINNSNTSISVLIKSRGDWTNDLYRLIDEPIINNVNELYLRKKIQNTRHNISSTHLQFYVDGPYTSPMTKIIHSTYAICIAGGIGITAFVSSLKHLLHTNSFIPKRLHLIWVVKKPQILYWFIQIICDLHHKCWLLDRLDRFYVELYVTKISADQQTQQLQFMNQFQMLEHRLNYRRPNFKQLFEFWRELYHKDSVNIFCCGPKSLLKTIRTLSIESNLKYKCNFNFIHDSYS